ncbi:SusC/RagA family TonB-linked outer membrane protein [Rhodohalobacter sp. SW132]|uniref:SusC/RagA family TonB-linked outer membrane protein n=1 Tax=Rhodohalobacter sp. SW132 TaxID=2293433 RepID=UPI000E270765|nr:SusC/RagA family TonB-linked outer membrane protein [Rhodohalobacter sp. SW132]REL38045.1 SusC/RagA family TonB-linked outer membrane protein [Rhodohalobacter sp. SW132]
MNGKWLQKNDLKAGLTGSATGMLAAGNVWYKGIIRISLTFGLIAIMGVYSAFAQDRVTITGVVTDAQDGSSLPGVNVTVQGSQEATGSTIGTTTNMDGEYTVQVPGELNFLEFSFIGYQRQVVEIDGRTEIDVELQQDLQLLDDVVVVGYGTQDRRQITGSISSVSSEDFVTGNVGSAAELIQGKVPGLNISRAGGNPNEPPTLRLRGVSSFGGAQSPLIVVDGIVGADLANIDPNDIESIDVLKDASAAAIYGTRGGAGVIAITTKKGVAGETSVSYSGSMTLNGVENKVDMLSADEFRELSELTPFEINDLGGNTDWFDEITQRSHTQIHNLSISGGTQATTYRVSGNFRESQGLLRTTGFEQLGGRLNINHRALNDQLTLTIDLGATNREEDYGFNNAFRYAATFNPTAPVRASGFDNTGGYVEIDAFDIFNPVAIVETAEDVRQRRRLNASFRADYEFDHLVPGLSASAFYSTETFSGTENRFWARTNKFTGGATTSSLGRGQAERLARDNKREQLDFTANYINTIFQDLRVETLAGYSFQDFESSGTTVAGGDFISDAVRANNLEFAQDFNNGLGTVQSFRNSNRLIAGFGRISMNWDDTYFANASIRREGSSRFGVNNRWGTFWSVGAGMEVTNLVDLGLIDRLRLRGSYGLTGLDAPFDGISRLRFAPRGNFFVGGSFVQSFGPVSNDNPDLKWEETGEYNIGVDFSMFDERLTGIVEYYQKVTSDLIFEIEVPVPPNLFPTSFINVGEIENKGIEVTLNYDVHRSQNAMYNTGITFTTYEVNLNQFESDVPRYIANVGSPGQNNTQMVRLREGEPLGQIWGPRFHSIGDDGRWRFIPAEWNGEFDTLLFSDEVAREDEAIIGNGIPEFELGWSNSVRFRNWDFNAFIRGVFGHDLVNSTRVFFENPINITTYNVTKSAFDLIDLESAPAYSSYHVEDASFIRLQNMSIGYTVPLPATSMINRLHLSVSGNNLFTITGYDGIDPEVRWLDGGDPLAPGIERREQWYSARSFTFGINLDF